ncbi:MAG: 4-hydroxy-tetrahydrodipicolinate synthase [Candidatus Omnitrophica bacterium]|nr:4-hydroxy-tetrahydrodipicolinate synthase [Candidatus Omnitrophota bacterium]
MNFKGSIVALVTPFNGADVDEKALQSLIEFHVKNGTSGIVPCGTTGESATLTYEEHDRVIELCVKLAKGRIPIIAGTGSNSTQEAVMMTSHAAKSGAAASLQVAPYYNRPTQKGLYEHFKTIAAAIDMPMILYNIPSRTGVNIEPETVAQLSKACKNITAIKEASGNLDQMSRLKQLCGKNFDLLSGDDSLTLPVLSIGGTGVISVVANIVPRDIAQFVNYFEKGDIEKAKDMHYKLLPLAKAMFIETNPIPLKTAMGLLGLCQPDLRLPMCAMSPDNLGKLKKALKDYGLL